MRTDPGKAAITAPSTSTESTTHYLLLALICLIPLVLYAPMLTSPFNGDEGFYATVARILLHGGIPYRDAFDNKTPLVFGWYALSFLLFGTSVWAPRLLVASLLSLTTGLIYTEARLIFSPRGGLIAAVVFALSMGIAKFETNAQTEYFMLLPMTAGLVAFTMATRSGDLRTYFIAGALNGVAIMTRQTAGFPFLAILAYAALVRPVEGAGPAAPRSRQLMAMLLGAMAVGIVTVLPFLITGTGSDAWDAVAVYSWTYSNHVSAYAKIVNLFFNILPLTIVAGPWLLLAGLGVAHAVRDKRTPDTWLLVALLAANVIGIVSVGRYYHHQYVQLLPALALLAPGGVLFLQKRWHHRYRVRICSYLALSLLISLTVTINGGVYLKQTPAARHEAVYPGQERTEWQTQSETVGEYIRDHTVSSDTIYNVGFQPELYFYADRRPASRYAFDHLFLTDNSLEQKAIAELTAHPPAYIIDSAANETQRTPYEAPLIRQFMRENYQYAGRVEYADVYILKGR